MNEATSIDEILKARIDENINCISDLDKLKELDDFPKLKKLKEQHFKRRPQICIELPRLMTDWMKNEDQKYYSAELRAGKRLKYILENKVADIEGNNLLAGTTTSKSIGAIIYPHLQYSGFAWPDLETIHKREKNPYDKLGQEELKELNETIFPYWMDKTIIDLNRKREKFPVSQQVMERIAFFICGKAATISHTIPDYYTVVNRGLNAIKNDAVVAGKYKSDRKKADFYQAVIEVIDGVLAYAEKLSKKAYEMSKTENDKQRKKELQKMGEVCKQVPAEKPRDFWEALNAIWICKVALHQENANIGLSLGRLDQILYPFYRDDVNNNNKKMTIPQALLLVGCFWLKLADHVPLIPNIGQEVVGGAGSNQAITLGGVKPDGEDAVNDLTYIMLKATELLKLRDPNVNCRYHPDVSKPEYLEQLCRVNFSTKATPCFHNDKSVIESLVPQFATQLMAQNYWMNDKQAEDQAMKHARDYGIVGCVEPTSAGRTFGHCSAIMINLTSALEMMLFHGKHPRLIEGMEIDDDTKPYLTHIESIKNFDGFKLEFLECVSWMINHSVKLNNMLGKVHQDYYPTPLLSALMEGCMKKGEDVIQGGARYNSSGVLVIGLAEVVDSLTAIQEFVFEKKLMTLTEMIEAVENNWGYLGKIEDFGKKRPLPSLCRKLRIRRQMVMASRHKFGTDSEKSEENANCIMKLLHRFFQNQPHYRGGIYNVGYWSMTIHAGFGLLTGALPSGRRKGESLPSGITPVSGSARELAPCLNFIAGLDHKLITNGHALNLKFTPSKNPERDIEKLAASIDAYMQLGGLQVQFNIIDRDILKDAMVNPDGHRGLLVRVSGYTAYFVDLNKAMQQEIIDRAEYNLGTGKEMIY